MQTGKAFSIGWRESKGSGLLAEDDSNESAFIIRDFSVRTTFFGLDSSSNNYVAGENPFLPGIW